MQNCWLHKLAPNNNNLEKKPQIIMSLSTKSMILMASFNIQKAAQWEEGVPSQAERQSVSRVDLERCSQKKSRFSRGYRGQTPSSLPALDLAVPSSILLPAMMLWNIYFFQSQILSWATMLELETAIDQLKPANQYVPLCFASKKKTGRLVTLILKIVWEEPWMLKVNTVMENTATEQFQVNKNDKTQLNFNATDT